MALTLQARMIADLVDENNIEAAVVSYVLLDPDEPLTNAVTVLAGWLLLLDAVTGGRIIASRIELLPTQSDSLKSVPEAGADAARTGNYTFNVSGTMHRWGFAVAALSGSDLVIVDGKPVITPGSPAYYLTQYMLVQDGTVHNTSDQYQQLEGLREAFISFRQYAQQMARRSLEIT